MRVEQHYFGNKAVKTPPAAKNLVLSQRFFDAALCHTP
jgi:hypothetical protein